MKTTLRALALVGIASLGAAAMPQSWNLAADYVAGAANPNAQWTYGQYISNVFSPMAWNAPTNSYGIGQVGEAFIYQNTGSYAYGIESGQISLEADWKNPAVRWTAPATGTFNFLVEMGGSTTSGGGGYGNNFATRSRVWINGVNNDTYSFNSNVKSWSFSVLLNAGDKVDAFVLNPGFVGGGNTQTKINVTQAVPEPASMAVLGLGMVGLLRRRAKKA